MPVETNLLSILKNTPIVLDHLTHDISEDILTKNEGGESWSVIEVLGHFIHGENTDWIPRINHILEHGNSIPFDEFDRLGHRAYLKGYSRNELINEFSRLRQENIKRLKNWNLTESQLAMIGTHPDLGTVSMKQLITNWSVHDLVHIAQISRVIGHQYLDGIGPWVSYFNLYNAKKNNR